MEAQGSVLSGMHRAFVIVGGILLAFVGLLVLASPLLAPPWAVVVLWFVWIAGVIVALRTWRRHMFGPLFAGGATGAFWVGFLNFGDLVLGWTA